MVTSVNSPVDGEVVTYDPRGFWAQHSIFQVYFGREGLNKVVPKINDWVINPETKQTMLCTAVDETTLIPTLRDITSQDDNSMTDAVGGLPDTYRVSFDTTSLPYTLQVDPRLRFGGSDIAYARLYRGTNAEDTASIISMMYDNQGNFLTNNIPLDDVARHNVTNILEKCVRVCKTTTELSNGEYVTLALLSSENRVATTRTLRVVKTSWIAAAAVDTRSVTHVSLISPYLSQVNPNVLEVPINVQLNALNIFAQVHYSDGTVSDPQTLTGKFALLGIEQFAGVSPSQDARLTLRYTLDNDEPASAATTADGKFVTTPYRLITSPQQGAFTIKLSGYPAWNSTEHAYRMHWFLTDLNRQTMLNVTSQVYYNESSDVFDGTKLGQIQRLSVRINLRDISSSYPSFIQQGFQTVTLDKTGDQPGPNWRIAFDINQQPLFGETLHARAVMITQNLWRVNVRFGAANFQDWLERIFYDAKPLYDIRSETKAPQPTHMVIFRDNVRTEVPIDQWDKEFQVSVNFSTASNIQIQFIRKEANTTLTLGVIAMPIKRV